MTAHVPTLISVNIVDILLHVEQCVPVAQDHINHRPLSIVHVNTIVLSLSPTMLDRGSAMALTKNQSVIMGMPHCV